MQALADRVIKPEIVLCDLPTALSPTFAAAATTSLPPRPHVTLFDAAAPAPHVATAIAALRPGSVVVLVAPHEHLAARLLRRGGLALPLEAGQPLWSGLEDGSCTPDLEAVRNPMLIWLCKTDLHSALCQQGGRATVERS